MAQARIYEEAYSFLRYLDDSEVAAMRCSIVLKCLERKLKWTRTSWQSSGLKPAFELHILGGFPRLPRMPLRMAAFRMHMGW